MKAILLSAGRGERLSPLTDTTQKVMLPIGGKPLLEYWVNLLKKYDIKDIAINSWYLGKQIEDYFGNGNKFGVNIKYSREESLLGTATPIKKIEKLYPGFCSVNPFLVIYADNLSNMNLQRVVDFHKTHPSIATLTLHNHENPWTKGIIKTGKYGRVLSFIEKPSKESILSKKVIGEPASCVMLFEPDILNYLTDTKEDWGINVLPRVLKDDQEMYAFNPQAYVQDIGTIESYKKAQKDFKEGKIK